MRFSIFLLGAATLMTVSCARNQSQGEPYTVTANVSADDNGKWAYVVNYDNGERIDSVLVADSVISISGTVETPVLARLLVGNQRNGTFVLEPGNISINEDRMPAGTPGNDLFVKYTASLDSLVKAYQAAENDSLRNAIQEAYNAANDRVIAENSTNPVGYFAFVNVAYEYDAAQLDSVLALYPSYGEYKRVKELVEKHKRAAATAAGNKFVDFTIEGDSVQKLSDYVGRGRYTLVDFWASWCGPCRREMPVIKELYDEFNSKGLDVVGVAVWDEPEDSKKAMEQLELPWPQILNAKTVPTDLYGISGIPHIMLIDPEGVIVARGMQGVSLRRVVRETMTAGLQKSNN